MCCGTWISTTISCMPSHHGHGHGHGLLWYLSLSLPIAHRFVSPSHCPSTNETITRQYYTDKVKSKRRMTHWRDAPEGHRDGDDEEEEVQHGIRRSRRATSYHYRDSSSLSPAQIMDQEVYYQFAKDIMAQCMLVLHVMVIVLNAHNQYRAFIGRWHRVGGVMSDAIAAVHAKMMRLRCGFRRMGSWLYSMPKTSLCTSVEDIAFNQSAIGALMRLTDMIATPGLVSRNMIFTSSFCTGEYQKH